MSNLFVRPIPINEMLKALGLAHNVNKNIEVNSISDSANTAPNSICVYIKGPLPKIQEGLVLLVTESVQGYDCIEVTNPRETLVNIINYIKNSIGFKKKYQNSSIHPSVKVGKNVVIEDNVEVGEDTVIEHNVVIHSGSRIGKNCLIRTHSSIGGDGYGYLKTDAGEIVKQPHLGGVYISDNVEIGSNVCVVRGIINDTFMGNNVKVDNLVHIAHDCHIEEEALIIACSELSGYVHVGKRARVAPKACVKQRVRIGNDAIVGLGAVVIKDVEEGQVVIGNPAKPLNKQ